MWVHQLNLKTHFIDNEQQEYIGGKILWHFIILYFAELWASLSYINSYINIVSGSTDKTYINKFPFIVRIFCGLSAWVSQLFLGTRQTYCKMWSCNLERQTCMKHPGHRSPLLRQFNSHTKINRLWPSEPTLSATTNHSRNPLRFCVSNSQWVIYSKKLWNKAMIFLLSYITAASASRLRW